MSNFKHTEEWRLSRRIACNKYEKTINGFLMRTYRNMKSRVTGVQKLKAHLYIGLELLPKNEFYSWAKANKDFKKLFIMWTASDHKQTITPSIDRIDSTKGYTLENMRWITHSENSSLGNQSRFSRRTSTTI